MAVAAPVLRGVGYLDLDVRIGADELEAAEQRQGLRVEPGDILLVRTGRDTRREQLDP